MKKLILITLWALTVSSVNAEVINVPADQPTIQTAVDSALNNDTILIADGTFAGMGNRDIIVADKAIVIKSVNGPEYTIIDAQGTPTEPHRVINIISADSTLDYVTIDGLTIQGGWTEYFGGGFSIGTKTILKNCIIKNNSSGTGGGVEDWGTEASLFYNCTFIGNEIHEINSYWGGAYFGWGSYSPTIFENCRFIRNNSPVPGSAIGFPMLAGSNASRNYNSKDRFVYVTITNCTFYDNYSPPLGLWEWDDNAIINNSIFANTGGIGNIGFYSEVNCCNIYEYGPVEVDENNGNISYDPLFCDTANLDLRISDLSVCAPGHLFNICGILIGVDSIGCSGCDDIDSDNICDIYDNCITDFNPNQQDVDGDSIGDSCDICINDPYNDIDEDNICGDIDNCPTIANPNQEDLDSDGVGDACDNCPGLYNPDQGDGDNDGTGDSCDVCTDSDNDGFGDPGYPYNTCPDDNCYMIPNPDQTDIDGDGFGVVCDGCVDIDNDGYGNPGYPNPLCDDDNCPDDYNPDQLDTDGDGTGDACEVCCVGVRGNIDGDPSEEINIADLVYFVDYSFSQPPGPEPPCMDEADVNGDDSIDISDIVYMVDYMFSQPSGPAPVDCL